MSLISTPTTITPPITGKIGCALMAAAKAGFEPGVPAHVERSDVAIDRQCVQDWVCERCEATGLRLIPLRPIASRRQEYRCLAYCARCSFTVEV